jgi:hypothetical protein
MLNTNGFHPLDSDVRLYVHVLKRNKRQHVWTLHLALNTKSTLCSGMTPATWKLHLYTWLIPSTLGDPQYAYILQAGTTSSPTNSPNFTFYLPFVPVDRPRVNANGLFSKGLLTYWTLLLCSRTHGRQSSSLQSGVARCAQIVDQWWREMWQA